MGGRHREGNGAWPTRLLGRRGCWVAVVSHPRELGRSTFADAGPAGSAAAGLYALMQSKRYMFLVVNPVERYAPTVVAVLRQSGDICGVQSAGTLTAQKRSSALNAQGL